MATLILNYGILIQIAPFFKSLEAIQNLPFKQRRGLSRINEGLQKENEAFSAEVRKVIEEYCERNEDGTFVIMDNGGYKIREDSVENANAAIQSLYATEVEIDYMPFKLSEEYFEHFVCDVPTYKFIEDNFLE